MVYFFFGSGVLFAVLAGLLAVTTRSVDLYILDRYFLVLPSRLLVGSALFFASALAIWDGKILH
jgi:hypothetical protein